ncbi:peptidoglycan/xylan/chitin deacetylase (PgdA/CDA1 family) [Rhodobacteraceae bacterium MBR-64]
MIIAGFAVPAVWFGIPGLYRWWATRSLARRTRTQRAIVLTYDDGPSDQVTPRLADLLQRRGIRATFFVIGREAVQRPAMIRRLQDDGHEIGNHTLDHRNAWKTGPLRALRDIRAGQAQLKALGHDTTAFRPPFGKSTLLTLLYSLMRGTRLAFWTHDSRDSWGRLLVDDVLKRLGTAGGGVLLMHDFDLPRRGPSPDQHPDHVVHLTESVIDFAETHDFKIIPFCDLFRNPKLPPDREPA